jgi:hypothetical protein
MAALRSSTVPSLPNLKKKKKGDGSKKNRTVPFFLIWERIRIGGDKDEYAVVDEVVRGDAQSV